MKNFLKNVLLCSIGSLPLLSFGQKKEQETNHLRPFIHFTPQKNWMNDPNGLLFYQGKYHLYFQYNPFGNQWGHMSWGHATSSDLLHWTEHPVAIPEDTTMIFSGSLVHDKHNTSGFSTSPEGSLVAIYTAHIDNRKQSQYIAYSNDGGMSFSKYAKNPVIDLGKKDFRDPNVFWHDGSAQWVMTVVLPLEYKVLFYGSKNLKDWSLLSEFANQGDKRKPWECPSLTELPVEGSNTSKWVLMLSSNGSTEGYTGMQYFVGDFDGKNFTNLNAPEQALYVDYGKDVYAGIPYNGLPKEQATLVAWMTNLNYTGDNPTFPWRGQMTIPRKLSLKNTSSGLRLAQAPAISSDFLEKKDSFEKENFNIKNTIELSGGTLFSDNAYLIEAEIEVKSANKVGFKIAQEADSLNSRNNKFETKVYYDTKKKSLILDRLKSSVKHHAQFPSIEEANYELKDGVLKLQILVDRMSIEVFANDGLTTITDLIFPSEKAKTLSIFTENGKSKVRKLKIWNLKDKSK